MDATTSASKITNLRINSLNLKNNILIIWNFKILEKNQDLWKLFHSQLHYTSLID